MCAFFVISEAVADALRGRHVRASFSGGADSLAMLLLLLDLRESLGFTLSALHFEHGFRGAESLRDAEFCRNFCQSRGVPCEIVSLRVPERILPGEGDEAAARRLRRSVWVKQAQGDPLLTVVLGHNADDRRENLLLRLARGSNSSGLTSMRAVQTVEGVPYVRPLLRYSRVRILRFLSEKGIVRWNCDSTNEQDLYRRNRIRHTLLPLYSEILPYAQDGLDRALEVLEEDARALETYAARAFGPCAGTGALPDSVFFAHPPAVQIRILRLFLNDAMGHDFIPDAAFLARVSAAFSANHGFVPLRDADLRLRVDRHMLHAETSARHTLREGLWLWRSESEFDCGSGILRVSSAPGSSGESFDAASLPDSLFITVRRPGDRMIPFGAVLPVKVKKLMIDAAIPAEERSALPVLRTPGGEIIWIPRVRRSAFAPVMPDTPCIRITFHPV